MSDEGKGLVELAEELGQARREIARLTEENRKLPYEVAERERVEDRLRMTEAKLGDARRRVQEVERWNVKLQRDLRMMQDVITESEHNLAKAHAAEKAREEAVERQNLAEEQWRQMANSLKVAEERIRELEPKADALDAIQRLTTPGG